MVNSQIRQFRDSIVAMTNANPLPIEIKRLVFTELLAQITVEADRNIMLEKQELPKKTEEFEEQENEN